MTSETKLDLREVISHFHLEGRLTEVAPYGTGHINDTYASRFQMDRDVARYVHQRINPYVFREPEKVMENIERVMPGCLAPAVTHCVCTSGASSLLMKT